MSPIHFLYQDKKNLVNGEDLKSEDLEEESTVIVDGVPSGSSEDEMDEPSEDSGPWGKTKTKSFFHFFFCLQYFTLPISFRSELRIRFRFRP